jgi:hypothetical protein
MTLSCIQIQIRKFTIQFTVNLKLKVLVHDLLGRKLFDKNMRVIATSIKHSVAAIANRIYLLTVIDGDRKEVKKLVIRSLI